MLAALAQSEAQASLLPLAASNGVNRDLTNVDTALSLQSDPLNSKKTSKHDIADSSLETCTGSLPVKFLREDALENWLDLSLGRAPQHETAKAELPRAVEQSAQSTDMVRDTKRHTSSPHRAELLELRPRSGAPLS